MNYWNEFDPEQTIRTYEYTHRAVAKMTEVLNSDEFAAMDADVIFRYLSERMEIVSFPDFLKRYIFEKTEPSESFTDIPDSFYQQTLMVSFEDNKAPFSMTETKSRKSTIVKNWMTNDSVSRQTVFLLGFGLKMPAEDVSLFLTKCIQEEDFDFNDPAETVFWFSYETGLSFAQAGKLLRWYEEAPPEGYSQKAWESMRNSPKVFLKTRQNLEKYLMTLKSVGSPKEKEDAAFQKYMDLYRQCCEVVAAMHNDDAMFIDGGETILPEEVTPADLEKELCSGIPVNKEGNLEKMKRSQLASQFRSRRMSRQRISTILNRKHSVERYDLITLLFFIYAQTVEPDDPKIRCQKYIDHINEILQECGMYGLYPVNPYESFVVMCLSTDVPMDVYAEVWERSYQS